MKLKWQEVILLNLVSAFFNRIRSFSSTYINPGKKSPSRMSHTNLNYYVSLRQDRLLSPRAILPLKKISQMKILPLKYRAYSRLAPAKYLTSSHNIQFPPNSRVHTILKNFSKKHSERWPHS